MKQVAAMAVPAAVLTMRLTFFAAGQTVNTLDSGLRGWIEAAVAGVLDRTGVSSASIAVVRQRKRPNGMLQ